MSGTCVHLNLGCCDCSKNKHATRHYHKTQHPIIQSHEPGEHWRWCYPDDMLMEGIRALAATRS